MGELITAKRNKTTKSVFERKQATNARQFLPHRGNRLFTLKPYGKEHNRFTESWKRGRAKHSVIIQDRIYHFPETHSLTRSLARSLARTHAHTHARTHAHTHTHTPKKKIKETCSAETIYVKWTSFEYQKKYRSIETDSFVASVKSQ